MVKPGMIAPYQLIVRRKYLFAQSKSLAKLTLTIILTLFVVGCLAIPIPQSTQKIEQPEGAELPVEEADQRPDPGNEPGFVLPELTEQQRIVFENNVSGLLTSALAAGQTLGEDGHAAMAGAFIIMTTLSPNYVDYMTDAVPEFDEKVQPLIDYINDINEAERSAAVNQAVADFGLDHTDLLQLDISYQETLAEYDPVTGTSRLTIIIPDVYGIEPLGGLNLLDPTGIQVNALTVDPKTLQREETNLPISDVTLVTEEDNLLWGTVHKLSLTVPGSLLKWSEIQLPEGVLATDDQTPARGYVLYSRGLSVADTILASRPLIPGERGRMYLTPNTYGAPEPKPLPEIPEADLEVAMFQELDRSLTLAVDHGDITREEADLLLDRYDDPEIIEVAKDPMYRAALMMAASVKETGGDMLLDVLLGGNSTGHAMRLMFEDDPELTDIFGETKPWPTFLEDDTGIVWEAPEGGHILVLNDNIKNGREPIQALAALMPHEVIAHEGQGVSIDEELLGNLIETITWAKLMERDPTLLTAGDHYWDTEQRIWVYHENLEQRTTSTRLTQFSNLKLLILINSQYPDKSGRFVGVTSKYMPEDYNTLPENNVESIRSFGFFIRNVSYADADRRGVKLDAISSGGKNIRLLLHAMFGEDIDTSIIDVVQDPNREPDFSELSTNFLDENLHLLITNERAVEWARLLDLELASSSP
jgi:hypothetical protein